MMWGANRERVYCARFAHFREASEAPRVISEGLEAKLAPARSKEYVGRSRGAWRFIALEPRPRTPRVPHNKSKRARDAEARGERTWTGWRVADLIEQVLRVNKRGVSEKDLRGVRNLEILKVKLLLITEPHHTKLRMPEPLKPQLDQYYGLNVRKAESLTPTEVGTWRTSFRTAEELDDAVKNLTKYEYYRRTRL